MRLLTLREGKCHAYDIHNTKEGLKYKLVSVTECPTKQKQKESSEDKQK